MKIISSVFSIILISLTILGNMNTPDIKTSTLKPINYPQLTIGVENPPDVGILLANKFY